MCITTTSIDSGGHCRASNSISKHALTRCHRYTANSLILLLCVLEFRSLHNRPSSPSSLPLHLLTIPASLQCYLHLSFLICAVFKQPPFSTSKIDRPPIVCLTKQHFSIFWCVFVRVAHNCRALALSSRLLCFRSIVCVTSLLWYFVGFCSAATGTIRSVTSSINTNLLINLF